MLQYGLFTPKIYRILISDTISCFITVIHDSIEVILENLISYGTIRLPKNASKIIVALGTDILLQPIRELKILHSASMVPFTRLLPFFSFDKSSILLAIAFSIFKEAKKRLSDNIFAHCLYFLQKFSEKSDNKSFSRFLDCEVHGKVANTPGYIEQSKSMFKMMLLDNISSIILSPVQITLWGLTVWNFGNSTRSLPYFPSGIGSLKPNYKLLLLSTTVEVILFIAMNESFNIVAENLLFIMKTKLMRGKYVFMKTIPFNNGSTSARTASEREEYDYYDSDENEDDCLVFESDFSEDADDIPDDNDEFNNNNDSDEWIDDEDDYFDEESDYSDSNEDFFDSLSQYMSNDLEAQRILQAIFDRANFPNTNSRYDNAHDHSRSNGRYYIEDYDDSHSD